MILLQYVGDSSRFRRCVPLNLIEFSGSRGWKVRMYFPARYRFQMPFIIGLNCSDESTFSTPQLKPCFNFFLRLSRPLLYSSIIAAIAMTSLVRRKTMMLHWLPKHSSFASTSTKCVRLVGCFSAARRFRLSYDTAFLVRLVQTLQIRTPTLCDSCWIWVTTCTQAMALAYESQDVAQKTVVVIRAIKTIRTHIRWDF